MIFEAFEFLVSLHLLLEVIRHKLALLAMASKLVRANEGFLALLRIERAFEQDGQIWDWLKKARIRAPVWAEIALDLEASGAVEAEDLFARPLATDQVGVDLVADHALEISQVLEVGNVVLG